MLKSHLKCLEGVSGVHSEPKIPEHQSPAQEPESNRRHSELFQTLGIWQKSFKFSSKHMENQMVSLRQNPEHNRKIEYAPLPLSAGEKDL